MFKPLTLLKLATVGLIALCMPRSVAKREAKASDQPNQHRQVDKVTMQADIHRQQGKG